MEKLKMTLMMTSLVLSLMSKQKLTQTVNAQIYYYTTVNQTRILAVARQKTMDNSGVLSPRQVSVMTKLLGQSHMASSFHLKLVERVQSLENRITINENCYHLMYSVRCFIQIHSIRGLHTT